MPTHLLALCSGRLKGKIQKTKSGMEVGVWAPPSLEEVGEVDLALDVSEG
jgi:aminopeptidase N